MQKVPVCEFCVNACAMSVLKGHRKLWHQKFCRALYRLVIASLEVPGSVTSEVALRASCKSAPWGLADGTRPRAASSFQGPCSLREACESVPGACKQWDSSIDVLCFPLHVLVFGCSFGCRVGNVD